MYTLALVAPRLRARQTATEHSGKRSFFKRSEDVTPLGPSDGSPLWDVGNISFCLAFFFLHQIFAAVY